MKQVFEAKPRWPGAPLICLKANLPAFETMPLLNAFLEENGPSCQVVKKGKCEFCGQYHAATIAPAPAGRTSGTSREL